MSDVESRRGAPREERPRASRVAGQTTSGKAEPSRFGNLITYLLLKLRTLGSRLKKKNAAVHELTVTSTYRCKCDVNSL